MAEQTSKESPVDRISNILLSDLLNVGDEILGEPSPAERTAFNSENPPIFGDDSAIVDSNSNQNDVGAPHNSAMAREEGTAGNGGDDSGEEEGVESSDESIQEEFSDPPVRARNNAVEIVFDDGYDSDGNGPPTNLTRQEEELLDEEEALGDAPGVAYNAVGDEIEEEEEEDAGVAPEPTAAPNIPVDIDNGSGCYVY